nr:hypothetical protein GCM10025730_29140 [Promicromonospora thailandica]
MALETRLLKHARTTTPGELSLVALTERERRLRPENRAEPRVVAAARTRRQRVSASPTGRPTR